MSTRALVVGAGPAGLAAAADLATWCDAVTVLEARSKGSRRAAGEHLPPRALSALARLGFQPLLDDRAHEPSPGSRSAWGSPMPSDRDYFTGLPGRGLNLDRGVFDEALADRAEARGVVVRWGTRLHDLALDVAEESTSGPEAGFVAGVATRDGGEVLHADLVVDATGRRAAASRMVGFEHRRFDDLLALTGCVHSCATDPEGGRIRIEAVEDGWWYAVQRSDLTLLATFMTDPVLLRRHPGTAADAWQASLASTRLVAPMAETGHWDGRVEGFDAATQRFDGRVEERGRSSLDARFVALGDAAVAWDPMSSWGITKAVSDGVEGAAALRRVRQGDACAVLDHRDGQLAEFARYRERQMEYYAAETRWLSAPFWRSRRLDRDMTDVRQEA